MAVTGRPGFKIVAPALLRVMPLNVYVYYQVARAGASKSEARIHEMQSALCDRTGVAGRLLKKKDQPLLWMEVYENVTGEDFEDALTRIVEEYGARQILEPGAQRHIECFVM